MIKYQFLPKNYKYPQKPKEKQTINPVDLFP